MLSSFRFTFASVPLLLSAAASSFAASPTLVALSGTLAPDGSTYTAFTNPVVNANGQVVFNASLTGTSTSGIFSSTGGVTLPVALQGTLAPNGELYGSLYTSATTPTVTINSSGQLAFTALGLTGGTPTSAIFSGTVGALQTIAQQGTAAPAGGNYGTFLAEGTNVAYAPVINASGQVAIQSTLAGGTAASGIFIGTSAATLQTVALVGGNAPASLGGVYATTVTVPTLNASGQVAFVSLVAGRQGIFAGSPGAAQTVMYQATAAPGAGGALYGTPTTTYSYNNAGQVGFISSLTAGTSTSGVFVGAPGSVQALALNKTVAPGGNGGNYSVFSNATVNNSGVVAFSATLDTTFVNGAATPNVTGLFQGTPGSVQAVALANTTAPDGATYLSFGVELQNNAGQVAFLANLTGSGVDTTNSSALFGGTAGNLTEYLRTGQVIDVDPSAGVDNRTISAIAFLVSGGGQDGKGTDFNDAGLLAYRLTFTDGSTGVFTSAVPEPASLSLAALAGVGLLRRRKSLAQS